MGSQVVQREQLGALDPNTGKSLAWNPGSDSFLGVQSLTWDDRYGLLVGHDGNRLGGIHDIGRHAIFPIGSNSAPAPEAPRPQTGDERFQCHAVLDGNTAVVSFAGDLGSSIQVVRNDVWAGEFIGVSSGTVNAYTSDRIDARLRGPNFESPFEDFACTTSEGASDVSRSTTVIAPNVGSVVDGGAVTISGESTAPDGIAFVRLIIRRQETGLFLTPDGSYSPAWTPIDIPLNTDATTANWSAEVNLESVGEYDLVARTFDANGLRDDVIRRNFTVGGAASEPPEITINRTAIRGNEVHISGTATDDVGVASVNFLLQNTVTQQYFRLDRTVGGAQSFSTTLSNPGETSTRWELTLFDLPVGNWNIIADAFDGTSQRDRANSEFTQSGQTVPPEISITSGIGQELPANSSLSFSGEATAPAGIRSVQVLVRDVIDRSGVGESGRLTPLASYFIVPGTAGGTSQSWTYNTPNLEAGTYDVAFRVIDDIGAIDVVSTQIVVGPVGDAAPATTIDGATRFVQGIDSLKSVISGTATDDIGVSQVAVTIFDHDRGRWLQPDGSYDRIPAPFYAELATPGGTKTTWSLDFNAPGAGFYQFTIRAIDSADQAASRSVFGTLRAYPGDAQPTVDVISPLDGVTIEDNRILINGNAEDDVALSNVEVRIRNEATGQFLAWDGSFGANHWLSASVTNVGGTRTTWDYSSPELPDGTWRIWVRAVDSNAQDTTPVLVRTITLN